MNVPVLAADATRRRGRGRGARRRLRGRRTAGRRPSSWTGSEPSSSRSSARRPPGGDEFTGFRTRRTGALLARSPSFRDVAAHPLVLGVLDRVLGDHATSYQLHLTQVIEIGPGEPAQLVHRDQWAFDFFPFPAGFEVECHTMWAMHDFTEENGATRVIPGSHRFDDKLRPTVDETVAGRDAQGVGAAVPRFAVPRRRREPFGGSAARE